MFRSSRTVRILSVIYKFFGIFCALWSVFWVLFIYYCLIEPTDISITGFGIICVIVGISGVVVCISENRLLRRMKKLQIILSPVSDTPISVISREWRLSSEKTEKQLKKMIQKGHLKSVRLDMQEHQVVPLYKPIVKAPVMVEVECENCGAANTMEKGQTGRCVYCDSVLKAK